MTNAPRQTKNERREEAREAARIQREKNLKKQKLLKWLVPTIASVAILALAAGVTWAVIAFQPPPKNEAGPANMISDGIVFEADGSGGVQYVETDALGVDEEPVPTEAREGLLNIETYIDFSCPHCKTFEDTYGASIEQLVADGQATLEVNPVAILGPGSVNAASAIACVADQKPESFLDVMADFFAVQGQGSSNGFYAERIAEVVGDDAELNECASNGLFSPWATASTERSDITGTPTVIVNGTQWDMANVDFGDFIESEIAKLES